MTRVVSNTSPLRYLVCIGEEQLWSQLFGKIFIPRAVFRELTHASAPDRVRNWIQPLPTSIEIIEVQPNNDDTLNHLDRGEIEAILLAEQLGSVAEVMVIT